MGKEGDFLRVFVVDDEKPCLDELVYLLEKQEGMEIAGAFTNPVKALEVLTDLNPDVAFIDLLMPRLNGAELASRMHANNPALKIVFVTAYAKELAKLGDRTASGSLLKPVNETKLHALMRLILG